MGSKTEKDMRLSSLTPSRSLVINFPFASVWRPVWQRHNLWFLLKQVMYRDRPSWLKDIKEWRLSPFFSHLFQYSITFMLRIMCLFLNFSLSRFNFQPLVLGMLFFTRSISPSLLPVKVLEHCNQSTRQSSFWNCKYYLFKLFYLKHFL